MVVDVGGVTRADANEGQWSTHRVAMSIDGKVQRVEAVDIDQVQWDQYIG